MKTSVLAVLACLVLGGAAAAQEHPEHPKAPAGAGALDGKVFVGELGKAGATTGDKDQLVFKQGMFMSSACVPFGFHDAPYSVTEKDGVVTFASSPTNAAGETMQWSGTVKDGALEGTAVHKTGAGQTTYWFKGKLGPADAATKTEHPEHPKKSEHPEPPKK